jgi:hypothetical protein
MAPESRHERRLAQCVGELRVSVGLHLGEVLEDDNFTWWAESNRDVAARLAGEFILRYISAKSSNVSLSQSVRLYRSAWRGINIGLPADVEGKLSRLDREKWVPAEVTRLNQLSHLKSDQYEQLAARWADLIGYMTTTTGAAFKALECQVRRIDAL